MKVIVLRKQLQIKHCPILVEDLLMDKFHDTILLRLLELPGSVDAISEYDPTNKVCTIIANIKYSKENFAKRFSFTWPMS
jgi:hypothetical protein